MGATSFAINDDQEKVADFLTNYVAKRAEAEQKLENEVSGCRSNCFVFERAK